MSQVKLLITARQFWLRLSSWCADHPVPTLVILWLVITQVKTLMAFGLRIPVVWGDAALYLSRARNLARLGTPVIDNLCGPDYPPLYSLLLAPAYLFKTVPEVSYHLALGVNALVSTSILFPAYLLHRRLTGRPIPSLLVALLTALLPASFVFSLTIMAENLMLPLILWIFLAVLAFPRLSYRVAVGVGGLVSAAILTKSLALGLIPGVAALAAVTLLESAGSADRSRRAWLAALSLVVGLALPLLAWAGWTWLARAEQTIPSAWAGYYPVDRYRQVFISSLTEASSALFFLRVLAKQGAYLFFSSFGLAAVAGVGLLVSMWRPGEEGRAPWVAGILFWAGILCVGTVHCVSYYEMDPERYSLFGRYADSMTPLLVVLASVFLHQIDRRRRLILLAALPCALLSALALPWPESFWLHRVGVFYLQPIRDLIPFRLLAVMLAMLPLALLFGFRRVPLRLTAFLLVGGVFAFSSGLGIRRVHGESRELYRNHDIVRYLRHHFMNEMDHLVVRFGDFQSENCFEGRHWILLYQTESVPFLFTIPDELKRFPLDSRVFFVTTEELPGLEPAAKEQSVLLYHLSVGELMETLER